MTIKYFNTVNSPQKIMETHIDNIEFPLYKSNVVIIKGEEFLIQFYTPTWIANSNDDAAKMWNKACGGIRGKRYNHLKKRVSTKAKMEYINDIITQDGCYLVPLKNKNDLNLK